MLDPTVVARIQKGVCAICGKEFTGSEKPVIVNDIRYGQVKVCDTHKVARVANEVAE